MYSHLPHVDDWTVTKNKNMIEHHAHRKLARPAKMTGLEPANLGAFTEPGSCLEICTPHHADLATVKIEKYRNNRSHKGRLPTILGFAVDSHSELARRYYH